ncbi:MAG: GNAT family N-acetyltransferase [Candidatus Kariarchaeaceae archaeon]
MAYDIVGYNPDFIEKQVDLTWEITGPWKYPYRTSYDALRKTYSKENFDPTTRFYVIENNELIGFIVGDVVRNAKKGDYGTLRFPIVKNNDREIASELMDRAFTRFKELGITKIRAPAGKGFGNTLDFAREYDFEQTSLLFKRTRTPVENLKVSGSTEGVTEFDDALLEQLKDIYETSMGMSKEEGQYWYNYAVTNRDRKDREYGLFHVSWKLSTDNDGISGFSYMHRSDQDPTYGGVAPFWSREMSNVEKIIDTHLCAHIGSLEPAGMKYVGTFLIDKLLDLEGLYSKFGFVFDSVYSYEKTLRYLKS